MGHPGRRDCRFRRPMLPPCFDSGRGSLEPIRWLRGAEQPAQLAHRPDPWQREQHYFSTNAFLPALMNGKGHPELVSGRSAALNLGQFRRRFCSCSRPDRLQGSAGPIALGLILIVGIIGLVGSEANWSVFWAAILGATCGAALALALALAPLLCSHPDEVARVSATAFAISYSFAMLGVLHVGRRLGYRRERERCFCADPAWDGSDPGVGRSRSLRGDIEHRLPAMEERVAVSYGLRTAPLSVARPRACM